VGIVVFILTLLASTGASAANLYYAEGHGEKIHPSVASSLRTTWWIYTLYTVGGTFLLWGAGMPLWPAVNHAMAALSTGGFAITSASIAAYPGIAVELSTVFLMLLGSISFAIHYAAMRKGVGVLWRNPEPRGFLLFAVGWVIVLFLSNLATMPVAASARLSYFQALSAATTTGFQTADLSTWTTAAKLILSGAMFVGATIGSTAGGLKAIRVVLLFRATGWQMRRACSGASEIVPFRLGGRSIPGEDANRLVIAAATMTFLWLCFLVLGVITLVHVLPPTAGLADIIFEVNSAQSTVGLTTGLTRPDMPTLAKLVLIFNMWVGRLEIIPVLMLLRALFLRRD
jgi:trk system potassium uptake protein TrkH